MKSWRGTNEHAINRILSTRNELQRVQMRVIYERNYQRKLIEDFYNELSGSYRDLCVALTTPISRFLALELEHAAEVLPC